MSKHHPPTTVVNHPPRFSIASASEPLRRSHASWTASSASDGEPSIRYATTRSRALCASNCSASNLSSCINLHSWVSCHSRSHSRVVIRHNNDERTLNDVTASRIYYPEHETPTRGGKPEPCQHGSFPTSVTLGETGSSINQEEIICTSSFSEPTGRREHS